MGHRAGPLSDYSQDRPEAAGRSWRTAPVRLTYAVAAPPLDVPTVAGTVPGYEASAWIGATARRGTPPQMIETFNREINDGLADPGIKARLADLGMTPVPAAPAEFGSFLTAETEKWGKVIKFAGIKAE
jgi:tripartite-type tricarboxylate transporter receptor subunit TctC